MNSEKTYYPLTHGQKGLWYTEQFYPGTAIGSIIASIRLWGDIDYDKLGKAINIFIEKNAGMRLRIVEVNGKPRQYVADHHDHEWEMLDFSDKGLEGFYKYLDNQIDIPFQLIDTDLFFYSLYKVGEQEGGIFVKNHHLISDAWTMTLMASEIVDFYTKLFNEEQIPNNPLPSYIDFVVSEQRRESTPEFEASRQYWSEVFSTMPELTTLKPRQAHSTSTKANRSKFTLTPDLTDRIKQYCDDNKVSGFNLFLAVLSIYLYRVTGKDDIVIGVPVLLRSTIKEQTTTGMFIDTIPVRLRIDNTIAFEDYINQVKQEWRKVRQHPYPYDILLQNVRDTHKSQEVLYDVMLSFQKARFDIKSEYETQWYFNRNQTDSLCISISDRENTGRYIIEMDWLTDLFTRKEIKSIYYHLITLLEDSLKNTEKKIYELEILAEAEKHQILFELNDTYVDYPRDKTIHQLFEEQVERSPGAVAVVFENQQLTYQELNAKANQVARYLIDKGVKPDEILGIMVNRSLEMIIGMLGIMKAGGAYLPLDPEYPAERIQFMLEDSGARILLTQQQLTATVDFSGDLINLDDESLYSDEVNNLSNLTQSTNLAYVIYTSGSTGKPKGVMIEHRNVINFITGVKQRIDFTSGKTILCVTTMSFDIFVLETCLALSSGLKVVIANEDQQMDPILLGKLIRTSGVDMIQMTPSRMQMLLATECGLDSILVVQDIMIGGEAFPEPLLKRLQHTKAGIYNVNSHINPAKILKLTAVQQEELALNFAE